MNEINRIKRDPMIEVQDRLRRIETRLTAWMESCGFDSQKQKAVYKDDVLEIPSTDIRLKDIIEAVPAQHRVMIIHKGSLMGVFTSVDIR